MRQIGDLTNEIQTLTESVEKLGEEGKVSESMDAMAKVEDLQKLKAEKEVRIYFGQTYMLHL